MKLNKTKIGILGGSFDPAHKGHLAISKEAKKRFELKNIIWAITKKNPFKNQSKTSVTERIKLCKKIIGNNSFIKVRFYENKINSNKTIDLINHLKKNKTSPMTRNELEEKDLAPNRAVKDLIQALVQWCGN